MGIFGPTDKDLFLLEESVDGLRKLATTNDYQLLEEQLKHHCIRIAWKASSKSGAQVRDVLREVSLNAFSTLYHHAPIDMADMEPINGNDVVMAARHLQTTHEKEICVGFFVIREAKALFATAIDITGEFPVPYGIVGAYDHWLAQVELPPVFYNTPFKLGRVAPLTSDAQRAYAQLLLLRTWKDQFRARVSSDALVRETVRQVAAATKVDPFSKEHEKLDKLIAHGRGYLRATRQLVPTLRGSLT